MASHLLCARSWPQSVKVSPAVAHGWTAMTLLYVFPQFFLFFLSPSVANKNSFCWICTCKNIEQVVFAKRINNLFANRFKSNRLFLYCTRLLTSLKFQFHPARNGIFYWERYQETVIDILYVKNNLEAFRNCSQTRRILHYREISINKRNRAVINYLQ